MIDLYLFNTIINTIWYIFTILFVLYRFTSFFSYIYNFVRFCGKLFNGIYFVYDQIRIYIRKRRGYVYLQSDDIEAQDRDILLPDQNFKHKTLLQKCKDYFSKQYDYYYFKIFGKRRNNQTFRRDHINPIHLTETTFSSNSINQYSRQSEKDLFDKQLSELCANNSSIDLNDYIEQHRNLKSSIANSSLFDINYKTGGSTSLNKSRGDDNLFESVELNGTSNVSDIRQGIDSSFLNNDYFQNFTQNIDDISISKSKEPVHPLHNNTYGVDSSFIKKVQSDISTSKPSNDLFIKDEGYPKFTKKYTGMSSSYKRNIETIKEEDDEQINRNNSKRQKENNDPDTHVFHIGSMWDNDFYTSPSDPLSNQQLEYGVDINNSSTYLRNNISYSMITNNKSDSDSDDDYANQILKNPYI